MSFFSSHYLKKPLSRDAGSASRARRAGKEAKAQHVSTCSSTLSLQRLSAAMMCKLWTWLIYFRHRLKDNPVREGP
ncbi:hypothetical protein IF1G_04845 [Cordyceps javanica]|uniref:Uncharacterized protein n=1 Tax=Cordyceps javanica TaxID=43265 RepID=A0A545V3H7_9HYPO|nr:hypothetical protein IF1G_04845 [Cordyceps javanica]